MKKLFKDWNLFEIIFMFASILVLTLCFAFSNDRDVFPFISSIIGVIAVLMLAKGLVIAPIVNIVYCVVYSILSIVQCYYGEAIIYIFLMIPIYAMSIVSWLRNKNPENKSTVKIKEIKGMEYLYLAIGTLVATFGFYFLLKALNTSELIVSTLSLVSSAVASYLMLRRCSYYAIGFIVNDVILIILWGLAMGRSGLGYLPTVISFVVFLVNDIYGLIHWKREEKKQRLSQMKTESVQE